MGFSGARLPRAGVSLQPLWSDKVFSGTLVSLLGVSGVTLAC